MSFYAAHMNTHTQLEVAKRPVHEVLPSCSPVTYAVGGSCVRACVCEKLYSKPTQHDGLNTCSVFVCVCLLCYVCACTSPDTVYLLQWLRCRLHLGRECATACWNPTSRNTHTHTHLPRLFKYSFPVKKSALANVLLLSKPALTNALKAPALRGQGAVLIKPQMVSSVSPQRTLTR